MEISKGFSFVVFIVMTLLLFNVLFTRDVLNWVPSIKRRFLLLFAIWLMPILGLFLANKYGNLYWFKSTKNKSRASAISQGFMEADAVFNPGMKHRIEIVEQQKSEIIQPGEALNKDNNDKNDRNS